jgi:hypothetical protein
MKNEELIEKLKKELPELNWKDDVRYAYIESNFACSFIMAGETCDGDGFDISVHVAEKMLDYVKKNNLDTTGRFNQVFNIEEGFISIDDIDDYILDLIIKGLRNWKNYIDGLRKSKDERDQLIFIHPDWDIESFKKDFKIIVGEDMDWRLGIINTKDWDFSNDELCAELGENSCDCFGIGPFYDMWDSLEEALEDWDLTEEYEELKKKYPGVDLIEDIYDTDFD